MPNILFLTTGVTDQTRYLMIVRFPRDLRRVNYMGTTVELGCVSRIQAGRRLFDKRGRTGLMLAVKSSIHGCGFGRPTLDQMSNEARGLTMPSRT